MGTQKNRLNETIISSTSNIGFAFIIREKLWEKELNTPPYQKVQVMQHQSESDQLITGMGHTNMQTQSSLLTFNRSAAEDFVNIYEGSHMVNLYK